METLVIELFWAVICGVAWLVERADAAFWRCLRDDREPPTGPVPEAGSLLAGVTRILGVVCLVLAGFAACTVVFTSGVGR